MARAEVSLDGQRFLVVEDEPLIAIDIASEIERLGGEVVTEARSVSEALAAVDRGRFDAAILDFQLSDGDSLPIAEKLLARSVPFAFCTGGLDEERAREKHPNVPIHLKPCNWQKLLLHFA